MDGSGNLKKIREMCLRNNISRGKLTDEYLFTLNAVDFYYFNRNMGEMDIVEGFVDGANDGGIDFILNKEDTMYLIQGKSSDKLSLEDIKNVFYKMSETVENFDKEETNNFSRKLKEVYLNRFDDLSDDKNIELVLFTNTSLDDRSIIELDKFKNNDIMSNYRISIYDGNALEKKMIMSYQGVEFVQEDSIELYSSQNVLKYKNDVIDGIIVNIKASSLKKIFSKHSQKGLFSFNLREHISQKNVDNGIDKTISEERENFWFYNNGITIGCVDYTIDGDKIKLYDFSIINGAQTTTKIGNSKIINNNHDFAVVCKIVKASGSLEESSDFISRISEASNSQKPIKPRDLKANSIEQKKLQIGAANNEYPLAIEIKRGVKAPKEKNINNKWQKVTNEYVGQLILACSLQKPGTARSGKSAIFSSDKVYNQVYKRKHDYNTLYDYVRIANIYDEFKLYYLNHEKNPKMLAVSQNGKFTVLAILFYLYKKFYGDVKDFKDSKVSEDNIKGNLTLDYIEDDYQKKLYSLFEYIIRKLTDLYDVKENELKLTSYSNFFKTDKTYQEIILSKIDELLEDNWDKEKIADLMEIFECTKEKELA